MVPELSNSPRQLLSLNIDRGAWTLSRWSEAIPPSRVQHEGVRQG